MDFTGLLLLLKESSVFIVKLIAFKTIHIYNYNLSLTGKLPIFLCQFAVATEIKTNKKVNGLK